MCVCVLVTYMLEAAPDARFDVAAPERCHLSELPWDLDGIMQQEPQLPLITRIPRRGHLVKQTYTHTNKHTLFKA